MQAGLQTYSSQIPTKTRDIPVFSGINALGRKPSSPFSAPATPQGNEDQISLSARGKELSRQTGTQDSNAAQNRQTSEAKAQGSAQQELTQEELKNQLDLQKRDTEVRAHEQAHLSAAGQYANGGASFSYVTGPGGKRYADGGEVSIDMSKEKTPEATIIKMRTVRRAALAPANPSGADRGIAARASSIEAQAIKDLQDTTTAGSNDAEGSTQKSAKDSEAAASSTRQKNSVDTGSSPQVSEFSREIMSAAYQSIAALAA